MPLLTLYGHDALRQRLRDAVRANRLPASILLHGPRGVGKQQLGLWLGRLLLCERPESAPCDACHACRLTRQLTHPDLHWFFPRPRKEAGDADPDEVRQDMGEVIRGRMDDNGLYESSSGSEGLFVSTVRSMVHVATLSPAMARRKIFVVGDAERMVSQEGSDQGANAFLKLLEEPPANSTVIITSSEPGALLPTIRSRVVLVRVAALGESDVRRFLADPVVAKRLGVSSSNVDDLVRISGGSPGRLLMRDAWTDAVENARRLLDAAIATDRGQRIRGAISQKTSGARGAFNDTLDALTVILHERARNAASRGMNDQAMGAARAVDIVEEFKEMVPHNVNPQLMTASLLNRIGPLVR